MEKHEVKGTLNVVGEGEVKAKPDVAILELGVVTENKSARDAVAENAARMDKLIARIKALGVPAEDIQTIGFNLSPITDWTQNSPTYGQIIRYSVQDTVNVRIEPKRAGAAIDEAMQGGANTAGGISFGLRDDSTYRLSAMKAAMHAATRDAELITATMKVAIAGINTIDVSHGGQPFFRGMLKSADAAKTPIEPGVITISARANVAYSITTRR
jgi:uncharacterized protein YggE